MRKYNEIGMKEDYEMNGSIRLVLHCLPALAMVPSSSVTDFFILADICLIRADTMHFFDVITLHYRLL